MLGAEVKVREPLTPVHRQKVALLLPRTQLPLLSPIMLGVCPLGSVDNGRMIF